MEFTGSIVMTLVFVSLLFAVSSGILASKKNRNFIGWFFTGLLFGPFALLVVLLPLLPGKTKIILSSGHLGNSGQFGFLYLD